MIGVYVGHLCMSGKNLATLISGQRIWGWDGSVLVLSIPFGKIQMKFWIWRMCGDW